MNTIKIYVEQLLFQTGLSSELVPIVRHIVLVLVTIALAWMAGWVCKLFIPLIIKVTQRTEAKWDDALFNERVASRYDYIMDVCKTFGNWTL